MTPSPASADDDAAPGHEIVAFRVGAQEFGVDIRSVREIRGWSAETALPHAPSHVRGVINLRGTVLPIVDLATRFGLPSPEPTARHVIMVTQVGPRTIGLLVDAVSDIMSVPGDALRPIPEGVAEDARRFVSGVLVVEGRMISLIALGEVLPLEHAAAA